MDLWIFKTVFVKLKALNADLGSTEQEIVAVIS
jgi:hypothetical protein